MIALVYRVFFYAEKKFYKNLDVTVDVTTE